jgi:hypothetical protein
MYNISIVNQEATARAEELSQARDIAEALATEQGAEVQVIHAETGAVAWTTSPKAIAKAATGEYFTPWTRVENVKFTAPEIPGYVLAYSRKRITAAVYRKVGDKGWLVHDGRTGNSRECPNTVEARKLTNAMGGGLEL